MYLVMYQLVFYQVDLDGWLSLVKTAATQTINCPKKKLSTGRYVHECYVYVKFKLSTVGGLPSHLFILDFNFLDVFLLTFCKLFDLGFGKPCS